ncbi:MAG: NADH-quinone oxidoreductase subunit NuoF [Candidatus Sericytochromatia bacterium]|nr:NADH-quinone oxidoreductase subunit NuoF [Candidatus Sericytochromatia bacterium]
MTKVLTAHVDHPDSHLLSHYRSVGGYEAARKAWTTMSPADIIAEVRASGLRGRGGAGFPTGMKWGFIPTNSPKPKYLVINADESEPGTFKDRLLIERNPHAVLEGVVIGARAIGARRAYIYIRGEFATQVKVLEQALAEAEAAGFVGPDLFGTGEGVEIVIHRGAGAYICGEETALINSLEGRRGYPRLKPPFPATHGAWDCPTCVNNVETIATIPWIISHGGAAYGRIGVFEPGEEGKPPKVDSRGTRLMCLSGHVARPGVYEVPLGISFRELIEDYGGGVWKGRKLKAVIPGGSSTPILTAEEAMGAVLTYEDCARLKTMFGSGGLMVIDDQTCMVSLLTVLLRFYAHESCGQCSPCREGTDWLFQIVTRLRDGKGRPEDLQTIRDLCVNMEGRTVCPLAAAATMPTISYLTKFLPEFEAKVSSASPVGVH